MNMKIISRLLLWMLLLPLLAVGQQQPVNLGAAPNDGTGDPGRTAFTKLNGNDTQLFGMFGGSSCLHSTGTACAADLAGTINGLLQPRTQAEISASVTPVSLAWPVGHPFRYMTPTQIASVLGGGVPTVDVTAALQATLTLAGPTSATSKRDVYWPAGHYLVSNLTISPSIYLDIHGEGRGTILYGTAGNSSPMLGWNNGSCCYIAQSRIHNLSFIGNGSAAHMISLLGISNIWLHDLALQDIPAGFDGIFINGASATSMHEAHIANVEYVQFTAAAGNAVVEFGALASDSEVDNLITEANLATLYGVLLDSGATSISIRNSHLSNHATNAVKLAGSNGYITIANSWLDFSNANLLSIGASSSNVKLLGDTFFAIPNTFSAITIASSTGVTGTNLDFEAAATAASAVTETGSSDLNTFSQLVTNGTFTAPAVFTGLNSAWRPLGGSTYFAGVGTNLAAGSTTYIANGGVTPSGTGQAIAQMPMATAAVVRGLSIQSVSAPGAAQTYTATVYNNAGATSCVATISGAASFGAQVGCFVPYAVGTNLSVQVVTSAGAAVSNVRLSVLVDY